jgi:hypothetical protein
VGADGTRNQAGPFCSRNRLPHLRDGQAVDRAPEKKRRAENFDSVKLARRRIFHGEFTANTIDLSAGSPRNKIEPSVKRTNLRDELGHLQAKRLAPRKGGNSRKRRSNPNRRQGILILNEIATSQR